MKICPLFQILKDIECSEEEEEVEVTGSVGDLDSREGEKGIRGVEIDSEGERRESEGTVLKVMI